MPPTAENYPKQEANAANGGKLSQARGQCRQRRETIPSKRPIPPAAGNYPRTGEYQSNHGKNSHLYPIQETATPEAVPLLSPNGKQLPQYWRVPIKSRQYLHLHQPQERIATPYSADLSAQINLSNIPWQHRPERRHSRFAVCGHVKEPHWQNSPFLSRLPYH